MEANADNTNNDYTPNADIEDITSYAYAHLSNEQLLEEIKSMLRKLNHMRFKLLCVENYTLFMQTANRYKRV